MIIPSAGYNFGLLLLSCLIVLSNTAFAAAASQTEQHRDWQLVGTVTGSLPLAIIRVKGEVEGIYQLNSIIKHDTIVAIKKNSIVLRHNHQTWQLDLEAPQARQLVPRPGAQSTIPVYQYQIEQKTFDSIRTDRQSWLNNVRMKMVIEQGTLTGYKITAVEENSPADLLGLGKGDVIRGINDIPVREAKRFMAVFARLKHARQFSLNLEHDKTPFTLLFTIK